MSIPRYNAIYNNRPVYDNGNSPQSNSQQRGCAGCLTLFGAPSWSAFYLWLQDRHPHNLCMTCAEARDGVCPDGVYDDTLDHEASEREQEWIYDDDASRQLNLDKQAADERAWEIYREQERPNA